MSSSGFLLFTVDAAPHAWAYVSSQQLLLTFLCTGLNRAKAILAVREAGQVHERTANGAIDGILGHHVVGVQILERVAVVGLEVRVAFLAPEAAAARQRECGYNCRGHTSVMMMMMMTCLSRPQTQVADVISGQKATQGRKRLVERVQVRVSQGTGCGDWPLTLGPICSRSGVVKMHMQSQY